MADGGNVEFVEIDGLVVKLRLQGACGSCPSSLTTMTMGIKRRLMEKIPVRGGGCGGAGAAASGAGGLMAARRMQRDACSAIQGCVDACSAIQAAWCMQCDAVVVQPCIRGDV